MPTRKFLKQLSIWSPDPPVITDAGNQRTVIGSDFSSAVAFKVRRINPLPSMKARTNALAASLAFLQTILSILSDAFKNVDV
jgi:hypothetical protein